MSAPRESKRSRELRERWATHPARAVACPRCHAAAGEPCVSCLGNITWPHIPRVQAAERANEEAARA